MRFTTGILALGSLFSLSYLVHGQYDNYMPDGVLEQHALTQDPPLHHEAPYRTNGARPFYAIAHRVLSSYGVKAAVAHGANALEIDMTAWKPGWWADHDGTPTSAGDKAEDIFRTIADIRRAGNTVIFVWLDLKNPDWCDPDDAKWQRCSITALRDLARRILEPAGIQVLYGFYGSQVGGKAFDRIQRGLNSNEALNINGVAREVAKGFSKTSLTKERAVMSYGYFQLPVEFGNCREPNYFTCTELRIGVESYLFGKVFGWTLATGQEYYADKLIGTAGVDGLIYGLRTQEYKDEKDTRNAIASIFAWLNNHSDQRYLARQSDKPW